MNDLNWTNFLNNKKNICLAEKWKQKYPRSRWQFLEDILTHSHSELLWKLPSATLILLKITWELRESLQNIWTRVVAWLLVNIGPSIYFQRMLFKVKYFLNCQACFGCSECKWVKRARVNYWQGLAIENKKVTINRQLSLVRVYCVKGKGKRYSVYSRVSIEALTQTSSPNRPVHTLTISIPRGIFQSNWQHIAHTL